MAYKILTDETFSKEMAKLNKSIGQLTGYVKSVKADTFAQVSGYVREGIASAMFSVGDQFEVERISTLTASKGNSQGITAVSVDTDKFAQGIGVVKSGVFELTFNGASWITTNFDAVALADYGITVTGTPVENDKIAITITTKVLAFDVLDFDKYSPKTPIKNSIVLGLHDIFDYGTYNFSASQLLFYAKDGLPAGKYRLTLNHGGYNNITTQDGTYMFTLTKPIPAGGGLRHSAIGVYQNSYNQSQILDGKFTTYGVQPDRAVVEENIATALWDNSTCTDLGVFTDNERTYYVEDASVVISGTTYTGKRNFCGRQAHGSNRWRDSAYRQWLNSNAPAVPSGNSAVSNWWKPATVFDRVPNGAKNAGFLYGLDKDFIDSLGEVEVKTKLHKADKVNEVDHDITYDKVFLQSQTDVFGGTSSEGSQLEYWKDATNADRIKYHNDTARYWWLRTPDSTYAGYVFNVNTSGGLNFNNANTNHGVVPACCICGKQTITNDK